MSNPMTEPTKEKRDRNSQRISFYLDHLMNNKNKFIRIRSQCNRDDPSKEIKDQLINLLSLMGISYDTRYTQIRINIK